MGKDKGKMLIYEQLTDETFQKMTTEEQWQVLQNLFVYYIRSEMPDIHYSDEYIAEFFMDSNCKKDKDGNYIYPKLINDLSLVDYWKDMKGT